MRIDVPRFNTAFKITRIFSTTRRIFDRQFIIRRAIRAMIYNSPVVCARNSQIAKTNSPYDNHEQFRLLYARVFFGVFAVAPVRCRSADDKQRTPSRRHRCHGGDNRARDRCVWRAFATSLIRRSASPAYQMHSLALRFPCVRQTPVSP